MILTSRAPNLTEEREKKIKICQVKDLRVFFLRKNGSKRDFFFLRCYLCVYFFLVFSVSFEQVFK